MNKERLVNNKYRKQEFEKRRDFGGAESFCNAYECCIFQNLLLEKDELEDRINKAIEYIEEHIKYECDDTFNGMSFYSHHLYDFKKDNLLNILRGEENGIMD